MLFRQVSCHSVYSIQYTNSESATLQLQTQLLPFCLQEGPQLRLPCLAIQITDCTATNAQPLMQNLHLGLLRHVCLACSPTAILKAETYVQAVSTPSKQQHPNLLCDVSISSQRTSASRYYSHSSSHNVSGDKRQCGRCRPA